MFPGNPLGLYDMNSNGFEWMSDWYAPDYYQHSPEVNPQGPASGQWKVVRNTESAEHKGPYNNNLSRGYAEPALTIDPATGKLHTNFWTGKSEPIFAGVYSFRCASSPKEPTTQIKQ
jgi:hypothetical protein